MTDDAGSSCVRCGTPAPEARGPDTVTCTVCGHAAAEPPGNDLKGSPARDPAGAPPPSGGAPATGLLDPDNPVRDPAFTARYEITGTLGRGGMGVVYSAIQRYFNREVAIKFTLSPGEKQLLRFRREGLLASKVDHRNVVKVFDGGEALGHPFLVMERVRGRSLQQHVEAAGGRLPVDESIAIMDQILDGLAAIHALGAVHRDLKPANVFITDDRTVKIGDFGLAWSSDATRVTESGDLMGTPAYMAPEQFLEAATDPSSDIYALGVLLYRMLSGRLPFEVPTFAALAHAHLRTRAPALRNLDPSLPAHLESLVAMALEKNPGSRPRTAIHFKRLLRAPGAAAGNSMCDVPTDSSGRPPAVTPPEPMATLDEPAPSSEPTAPAPGLAEYLAMGIFVAGFLLSAYVYRERVRAIPEWPAAPATAPGRGGS